MGAGPPTRMGQAHPPWISGLEAESTPPAFSAAAAAGRATACRVQGGWRRDEHRARSLARACTACTCAVCAHSGEREGRQRQQERTPAPRWRRRRRRRPWHLQELAAGSALVSSSQDQHCRRGPASRLACWWGPGRACATTSTMRCAIALMSLREGPQVLKRVDHAVELGWSAGRRRQPGAQCPPSVLLACLLASPRYINQLLETDKTRPAYAQS